MTSGRWLSWAVLGFVACGDDAREADTSEPEVDASTTTDAPTEVDDVADVEVTPDVDEPSDPAARFALLGETWCAGAADIYCAAAPTCGCGAAPGFPETAACASAYVAQCRDQLEQYREPVLNGNAVVSLQGITPCLAAMTTRAEGCVTIPGDTFFIDCPIITPPGGFGALPGEGVACGEGGLCALGLRCDALGTCRVPGDSGADCEGPSECRAELSCVAEQCAAPDLADLGQVCASPEGCDGDTGCLRSSDRICETIIAGQACVFDGDCLASQYCDGATTLCTDKPASGPCGNGAACAVGTACGGDPRECRALPTAGQECADGSSGPVMCATGLACNNNICGELPAEGDACAIGEPACGPGLGCAFESEGSFCRVPAPADSACQNDATCASGLFCDFGTGTCQAFLARGDACSDGNECGPGAACLPNENNLFECADEPGVGGRCFIGDCAAGLACHFVHDEGACVRRFCAALDF